MNIPTQIPCAISNGTFDCDLLCLMQWQTAFRKHESSDFNKLSHNWCFRE